MSTLMRWRIGPRTPASWMSAKQPCSPKASSSRMPFSARQPVGTAKSPPPARQRTKIACTARSSPSCSPKMRSTPSDGKSAATMLAMSPKLAPHAGDSWSPIALHVALQPLSLALATRLPREYPPGGDSAARSEGEDNHEHDDRGEAPSKRRHASAIHSRSAAALWQRSTTSGKEGPDGPAARAAPRARLAQNWRRPPAPPPATTGSARRPAINTRRP